MKCPACDGALTPYQAGNVTVDICREQCGGVWFDSGEFEQFDEPHEHAPHTVLHAVSNQNVAVDRNRTRYCPKCNPVVSLSKRFFDPEHELQLDQCDHCHGIWVDLGELKSIREANGAAHERQAVVDDFYKRATDPNSPEQAKRGIKGVLQLLFK